MSDNWNDIQDIKPDVIYEPPPLPKPPRGESSFLCDQNNEFILDEKKEKISVKGMI